MRTTVIFCVGIFFFVFGMLHLFWPDKMRKWSRIDEGKMPESFRRIINTKGYYWSFRVGGFVSILASAALVWVYFHPN